MNSWQLTTRLWGLIKRVANGVTVNEDTIGLDVISSAVNGGMILAHPHTVKYLRCGELFIPKLGFDSVWSDWEKKGQKRLKLLHVSGFMNC